MAEDSGFFSWFDNFLSGIGSDFKKPDGSWDWTKLNTAGFKLSDAIARYNAASNGQPTGYQGVDNQIIPKKQAIRAANTFTNRADRRAGAGGTRYFTGTRFATQGNTDAAKDERTAAWNDITEQRTTLSTQNRAPSLS